MLNELESEGFYKSAENLIKGAALIDSLDFAEAEKKFDEVKFVIKKTFSELDDIDNPYKSMEDLMIAKTQVINIGRKTMARSLAEIFMRYIRKGELLEGVKESLKDYDTTLKQFTEICEKNGI